MASPQNDAERALQILENSCLFGFDAIRLLAGCPQRIPTTLRTAKVWLMARIVCGLLPLRDSRRSDMGMMESLFWVGAQPRQGSKEYTLPHLNKRTVKSHMHDRDPTRLGMKKSIKALQKLHNEIVSNVPGDLAWRTGCGKSFPPQRSKMEVCFPCEDVICFQRRPATGLCTRVDTGLHVRSVPSVQVVERAEMEELAVLYDVAMIWGECGVRVQGEGSSVRNDIIAGSRRSSIMMVKYQGYEDWC
ncbi:hypothetical protein BT96DRAFT_944863 [Gymnopus androsaceus JB14]|uniref:Uncharacterized protein n=1 Tax=Gymnopus androsaceus JB14 TaxID=1447944 RepID=A0A6A4H2Z7_9AGAR|nr:hypothetical protein BT96DRAFT_944863 [Gymnopus androsaceus JB14]